MAGPEIAVALTVGSTVLSTVQGLQQAGQQEALAKAQSRQNQMIADNQARQMQRQANEERAISQQNMLKAAREKMLAQSRAQAVSAASGGGALDKSVMDIIGDLEEQGTYNQLSALREGEEQARGLEYQAALTKASSNAQAGIDRYTAKVNKNAARVQAVSSLLSGASSAYDKYSTYKARTGTKSTAGTVYR